MGFPGSSAGRESACNAEDLGLIPGLGRSPGEGNGNPLQYSCLGNPMDRGAWQATVHGVTKELDMTQHQTPTNNICGFKLECMREWRQREKPETRNNNYRSRKGKLDLGTN